MRVFGVRIISFGLTPSYKRQVRACMLKAVQYEQHFFFQTIHDLAAVANY